MLKLSFTILSSNICVALFARGDGLFHWAFVIPNIPSDVGGTDTAKLHVTNREGGWKYEMCHHDLAKEDSICSVVKIGESSDEVVLSTITYLS